MFYIIVKTNYVKVDIKVEIFSTRESQGAQYLFLVKHCLTGAGCCDTHTNLRPTIILN